MLLAPSPGRFLLGLVTLSLLVVLPLAFFVTKIKATPEGLRRRRLRTEILRIERFFFDLLFFFFKKPCLSPFPPPVR